MTTLYPLYLSRVEAGFASPVEDYKEGKLDLNPYLISNPPSTFFVRVSGDSMVGAGIQSGSLLVVDRSIKPVNGKIVIAVINGELTVKRLKQEKEKLLLKAENPSYKDVQIIPEMDFSIWGVVTAVVTKV